MTDPCGADPGATSLPPDVEEAAGLALLAAPAEERESLLRRLIAAHPRHAAALRRLGADLATAERALSCAFTAAEPKLPSSLGGHRVLARLGEGAFGTVYLCEQTRPVVRRVAVKVLRSSAADEQTLRRFEAERQLLAQLNHATITQIFDAGELPDGRPFIVMEHVAGVPISTYCESRGLSCEARLRLFVELCRGIEHAHGRGIVHRDLKPANVLVVETESGPVPKIIDFGIAKALRVPAVGSDPHTDAGRVVGTPGYMSPEQAEGRVAEVTPRSDVFSLGVMLYELLTGELPWERGSATSESEPVRPSARLTARAAHAKTTSSASPAPEPGAARRTAVLWAATLRGDLDWITLHALARDPARRYETARALAEDLEAHLRGAPVTAGPPSLTYRLRKFARRNRASIVVVGTAMALLAVGLGFAVAWGRRAAAAADAAKAHAASSFEDATAAVESLLARANDDRLRQAPASDVARQALLQDALQLYDRFLRTRPGEPKLRSGRCSTLMSLSQVYFLLGQYGSAQTLASEAKEEAQAVLVLAPENDAAQARLADCERRLGNVLRALGQDAAAARELESAVAHLETCHEGPHALALSGALRELAATPAWAADEERRVEAMQRSIRVVDEALERAPDSNALRDERVFSRIALARRLLDDRSFASAKSVLRAADAALPAVTTDQAQAACQIHGMLGQLLYEARELPAAVARFSKAIAAAEQWCQKRPLRPQAHANRLHYVSWLATAQHVSGSWDEAAATNRTAIALCEDLTERFPQDPQRYETLAARLSEFARLLWDRPKRNDLDEAAELASRALLASDRTPASVDAAVRVPRWRLLAIAALIGESRGDPHAAELWRETRRVLPAALAGTGKAEQGQLIEALVGVARSCLTAGELEDARARLEGARAMLEATKPEHAKLAVDVGWLLARIAVTRGDAEGAAACADAILEAYSNSYGKSRAGDCLFCAWRALESRGSAARDSAGRCRDRAAALYSAVIAAVRQDAAKHPEDPWIVLRWAHACLHLAQIDADRGETQEARSLLEEALPALARVEPVAHVDQWDATLVGEGRGLLERLLGAGRR